MRVLPNAKLRFFVSDLWSAKVKSPSKREQKRLAAAEEACRCFRKGMSYYATQEHYFNMGLDWILVWIKHSPKKVWTRDPIPAPRRKQ